MTAARGLTENLPLKGHVLNSSQRRCIERLIINTMMTFQAQLDTLLSLHRRDGLGEVDILNNQKAHGEFVKNFRCYNCECWSTLSSGQTYLFDRMMFAICVQTLLPRASLFCPPQFWWCS